MQRARKVQSCREVSISPDPIMAPDRGQLPNGVIVEKRIESDNFWGSREALIEAGIAKASWFPTTFPPGKSKGTSQASFDLQDEGRSIRLFRAKKGARPRSNRWSMSIEVSAAEKAKRSALKEAMQRQQEADELWRQQEQERREEEAREEQVREAIEKLPPFVPGSMTEFEKYFMRIIGGLDEQCQLHLCDMAKLYLLDNQDEDPSPDEPQPTARPRLTLAIDNTRC